MARERGISAYRVAPDELEQWRKVEHDLRHGGILIVRWLDRVSRRSDELLRTMHRLMALGAPVECTLNGMGFDGKGKDLIRKATRNAVLAFMATQGETDCKNCTDMQRRGVAIAKAASKYTGRGHAHNYVAIRSWRAENGARIQDTAEKSNIGTVTVKQACAEISET